MKKEVWNNGSLICEKYYAGSFVYNNEGIEYILFDEGRLTPKADGTYQYEYFLCDHLGNTRVVFTGQEEGLAVLQENHYYPFGMEFMGVGGEQMDFTNYYKYNGKELQDDGFDLDGNGVYESRLLWYDYGARFYDAQLGRWHTVDPLAEKYFDLSPYNYVANNPLKFIDPNGMNIDNYTVNEEGVIIDIEKNDEPHRLFVQDESDNKTEIEFNDPENDREQLETFSEGEKAVEFVSDEDVNGTMDESKMEGENLVSRWFTAATQSENKMDFGVRYLKANPTKDNTGGFVVFGSKNKAYNLLDGGNFLWGQGMKRLGFDLSTSKFGADANEGFNDTPTDQKAIEDGYNYNVVTNEKSDKYKYKGNKNARR